MGKAIRNYTRQLLRKTLLPALFLVAGSGAIHGQNISQAGAVVLPISGQTTYTVASGSTVQIKSGTSVMLQPGVSLANGSAVTISIDPSLLLPTGIPVVTSLSAYTGVVGATLTISGSNFNATAANNVVYFGSVKAVVTGATTTSLNVTVPAGAMYGPVSVTDIVSCRTGFSALPFRQTMAGRTGISTSDIETSVDLSVGNNPFGVAVADFDGNGTPDILVVNTTGNTVSVMLNSATAGSGISGASFVRKDFAVNANPSAITVGDFNGDGKKDIAVGYQTGSMVSVLTNTTTGGTLSFSAIADFGVGSNAAAIANTDIDGDGRPELIVANFKANSITLLRNVSSNGSTSFTTRADFVTGTAPSSLSFGDIDGDGKPEVIVGNYASNTVSVFKNNAVSGTLSAASLAAKIDYATTGQPMAIYLAQIDNDTRPDLIISTYNAATTTHSITISRNAMTATGTVTASSFSTPVVIASGSQPVSVGMGDIDGDGLADIVAANYNGKSVSVYRNTSAGTTISAATIVSKVDFSTGNTPYALALCDLDRDGRPDIVSANDIDNTISVLHNANSASVPAAFPESTAAVSLGSFVNTDIYDFEWGQDPPVGYTIAAADGTTINPAGNAGTKAGRFVYFGSGGSLSPLTYVNGALSFSAKGTGTIEVQLINTYNMQVSQSKTFVLGASFQDYGWKISNLYPKQEYILGFIFNGPNTTVQASGQFKKNIALNLQQAGMSGNFIRYRADVNSLIGNKETSWYGYSDTYGARKKYLSHSAYSRMRFETDATQLTMEYVRDFYDKNPGNIFSFNRSIFKQQFNTAGDTVRGNNAINVGTVVRPGATYTISGLKTQNPVYAWYNSAGHPIDGVHSLTIVPPYTIANPVYQITAPAGAAQLALQVMQTADTVNFLNPNNETYLVFVPTMIEEGAIGGINMNTGGTIPTESTGYTGLAPSRISGPAVFVNGKLYNYYQVENNDAAKIVQYVTDILPPGMKTVEVMMTGQGTYTTGGVLIDPHIRRSGNYLRAVYFPVSNTTPAPGAEVKPGSVLYIHDSILSGFNISSNAQNNVWMMKVRRDSTFGFTGDVFSEGYAGRILHTDMKTPALLDALATKIASFNVDKIWIQAGVNDYANVVRLDSFYVELNTLVEKVHTLRSNAIIYIQGIGPVYYDGPNSETFADNPLQATGPSGNDFRDIQRAIATAPNHNYCRYVDFGDLFDPNLDNVADGIHPTDQGNELYAQGIKNRSDLLGNILPVTPLRFNRDVMRQFTQSVFNISFVTAAGGKAPYTFSVPPGSIPSGLTFNTNGVITGTVPGGGASGTFPINFTVTDANGTVVSKVINLVINPVPQVVVRPIIIPNGQVGVPYSLRISGVHGFGKYTVTKTGGNVPGMTYDPVTNSFSGTPTAAGTTSFTLTAVDHYGFTGSTNYNFVVGTTTPPPLTDNVVYTASVSPAGDLLVNGTVHDLYTRPIFLYVDAYVRQNTADSTYQDGGQIIIPAGAFSGTPVNFGHVVFNGNFQASIKSYDIASDNTDITFTQLPVTKLNLTGNSNTGPNPEYVTVTAASINAAGNFTLTVTVPNTHSRQLLPYMSIYTKKGTDLETYFNGAQFVIEPGTTSTTLTISRAQPFGTPAPTGSFTARIFFEAMYPTIMDGKNFPYGNSFNFNLTH